MAIAKKIENTPILPNFNTNPFLISKLILGTLMLLFCFYNEYISLQMKEIYKMSILEEIISILVLKWYFKLEILYPRWL